MTMPTNGDDKAGRGGLELHLHLKLQVCFFFFLTILMFI